MPVIAVGAAVAATVGAASGIAAAGLTLTTALEAVAAVGATLGAVGSITGNKTLTMIGAGLGLVGGIGAVASGAGLFGAAGSESLFGSSGSAADGAAAAAGTTGSDTIDTLSNQVTQAGMNATAGTSQGASDALTGWQTTTEFSGAAPGDAAASATAAVPAPGTLPETGISAGDPTAGAASAASPAAPVGQAAAQPPMPSLLPDSGTAGASSAMPPSVFTPGASGTGVALPGTAPTVTIPTDNSMLPGGGMINSTAAAPTNAAGTAATAANSNTPGFFGNILNFAEKHPMLAYGAVQAGGNLISGMTSTLTPAQVSALNAQAAQNQATANLTTQQAQNLAQPKAVASLMSAPGPRVPIVTQNGLINSTSAPVMAA